MDVPDVNNTTNCCVFHRYIQQNKITSHNPIQSKTFTLILIKVKVMSLYMPQGHMGVEAMPHTFTILALKSCESSASHLHCLTPGTNLTGGPKASPDTMQNIKHLPLYSVEPAWLFYHGSKYRIQNCQIWSYLWGNIKESMKAEMIFIRKGCRRVISNQVQEIKCWYTGYMRKQTLKQHSILEQLEWVWWQLLKG